MVYLVKMGQIVSIWNLFSGSSGMLYPMFCHFASVGS